MICFQFQGLVIAGIADLKRPVDKLSVTQTVALAATGNNIISLFIETVLCH
jgi:hypothetical protein